MTNPQDNHPSPTHGSTFAAKASRTDATKAKGARSGLGKRRLPLTAALQARAEEMTRRGLLYYTIKDFCPGFSVQGECYTPAPNSFRHISCELVKEGIWKRKKAGVFTCNLTDTRQALSRRNGAEGMDLVVPSERAACSQPLYDQIAKSTTLIFDESRQGFFMPYDLLRDEEAQRLLNILIGIAGYPIRCHNIWVSFNNDTLSLYRACTSPPDSHFTKKQEIRIGDVNVTLTFYSNGWVGLYIACSGLPFRIENEEDVQQLDAFLASLHARLGSLVQDSLRPYPEWVLTRIEFNYDIPFREAGVILHLAGLTITNGERIFSVYIKAMKDGKVCRVETRLNNVRLFIEEVFRYVFRPIINGTEKAREERRKMIESSFRGL